MSKTVVDQNSPRETLIKRLQEASKQVEQSVQNKHIKRAVEKLKEQSSDPLGTWQGFHKFATRKGGSVTPPVARLAIHLCECFDAIEKWESDFLERGLVHTSQKPVQSGLPDIVAPLVHPPSQYAAQRYLLQAPRLVGRHSELAALDDWLNGPTDTTIRVITQVGGSGKSALSWNWFQSIADRPGVDGSMWWSFYDNERASIRDFLVALFCYLTKKTVEDGQKQQDAHLERSVLQLLDSQQIVLVLDGFERVLNFYAGYHAAYLMEDRNEDASKKDHTTQARRTTEVRYDRFLQELVTIRKSRILISSRLIPAAFDVYLGSNAAVFVDKLKALKESEAIELWQLFGGSDEEYDLKRILRSIDFHPLTIRVLSSMVKQDPKALDGHTSFSEQHPGFLTKDGEDSQSHVLALAFTKLHERSKHVLSVLAAFRGEVSYDQLNLIYQKAFQDSVAVEAIEELQDWGLIGWDASTRRLDMHPIVRANARLRADKLEMRSIFESIVSCMDPGHCRRPVLSLATLFPAIEKYHALIHLEQFDQAYDLYREHLQEQLVRDLSSNRENTDLLEQLFASGFDDLPHLSGNMDRIQATNWLAQGYQFLGELDQASRILSVAVEFSNSASLPPEVSYLYRTLASIHWLRGDFASAHDVGGKALLLAIDDDSNRNYPLGVIVALMYLLNVASSTQADEEWESWLLDRILTIEAQLPGFGGCLARYGPHLAELVLRRGDRELAGELLQSSVSIAESTKTFAGWKAHFLRTSAMLQINEHGNCNVDDAAHSVERALDKSRDARLTQEEIPALLLLSQIHSRQQRFDQAVQLAGEAIEIAKRHRFKFFEVDARIHRARIAFIKQDWLSGREHLMNAATMAVADGPPFWFGHAIKEIEDLQREFQIDGVLIQSDLQPASILKHPSTQIIARKLNHWMDQKMSS
ncbi:MAG: hypothetical protein AAGG48_07920 [Planctomycetota bacterium]